MMRLWFFVFASILLLTACNLPSIVDSDAAIACDGQALVQAIEAANNTPETLDVITLAPDCEYILTEAYGSIELKTESSSYSLPRVLSPIRLEGNGAIIRRDSDEAFRVFIVTQDGELTLSNLTLRDGEADYGGALFNRGQVYIFGSTFEHNHAVIGGGAIYNDVSSGAVLEISGAVFDSNWAASENSADQGIGYGGAIANIPLYESTDLLVAATLSGCTFTNNYAVNSGGAIANDGGNMIIEASSFIRNRAFAGGAVNNRAQITLNNSTFFGNWANVGGAAYSAEGMLSIFNSTLYQNGVNYVDFERREFLNGSAIYLDSGQLLVSYSTVVRNGYTGQQRSALVIVSTIGSQISNSLFINQGIDCSFSTGAGAAVENLNTNFDHDGSCGFMIVADPGIGGLGEYGGPTLTVPLLEGSPALDAAQGLCPEYDQRGEPRPAGQGCDIGAFEGSSGLAEVPGMGVPPVTMQPDSSDITEYPEGIILRPVLCRIGPGAAYSVISALEEDTRVSVAGIGEDHSWVIIQNPVYGVLCWVGTEDIDTQGLDLDLLAEFQPPILPTEESSGERSSCSTLDHAACESREDCFWSQNLAEMDPGRCVSK